jgi:hypothetical protein
MTAPISAGILATAERCSALLVPSARVIERSNLANTQTNSEKRSAGHHTCALTIIMLPIRHGFMGCYVTH